MLDLKPRLPDPYPPFASLPVRLVAAGDSREKLAVHVHGILGSKRPPVVCLAGFQRNMSDFADLVRLLPQLAGDDWPMILIDLKGRGRASPRHNRGLYSTLTDAADVLSVLASLSVPKAFFLGQGHGGLVSMLVARDAPTVVAGTVLVDAGPIVETRGLVRLKNNLADLGGRKSDVAFRAMVRRVLSVDYPLLGEERLDAIGARTHFLDRRGRVVPLYDPRLVELLAAIEHDDLLTAQWALYDGLDIQRLMLVRTQRTDLVRRDVFEEMVRRRPAARVHLIEGQGSPALFDSIADVEPVARFVAETARVRA